MPEEPADDRNPSHAGEPGVRKWIYLTKPSTVNDTTQDRDSSCRREDLKINLPSVEEKREETRARDEACEARENVIAATQR